ncbi:hypothetical protein PQ472_00150 [Lacticaseibacillus pabuli]|uniref:Motility protein YjfB-like n=1 Tax=Lacticaseibacillus pabuli TaxID=3025672 RepID=A0ABY7WU52_9LACO|nr:hypothetical protein [Lacticaseibacillus sp. KACC 23028]WDF82685.1 hypothetical protein PQ472_00150 [Lacticaseibacillus sp. KACC 23028]
MHTVDEKDFMLLQRIGAANQHLQMAQTFMLMLGSDEPEAKVVAQNISDAMDLLSGGGQVGSTEEAL